MSSSTEPLVRYDVNGRIALLVLNRAHRLNALVPEMHEQLQRHVAAIDGDSSVRAAVLTGSGRAFCAGGDVRDMAARSARHDGPDERRRVRASEHRRMSDSQATVRRLATSTTPIVAAINGPVAGVGLSLALSCDLLVAADTATFSVAFPRMGLPGDGGISALLPAAIGVRRARAALLRGTRWTADEALRIGLVDEAVARDDVTRRATALAEELARGAPVALGIMRSHLLVPRDLEAAFEREVTATLNCLETEDHREAVSAFLERREPRFEGR